MIGAHLRTLREQTGLSQAEVARRMHTVPSAVNHLEKRGKDAQISTILRYCAAIGARVHIGFPPKGEP